MHLDYDRFSVESCVAKDAAKPFYNIYDLKTDVDEITLFQEPISNELKLSVLVIDDSNVINKIMSKKLSSLDICVHTATSVTNSIEQQQMFYYDAVIIDIYLEPFNQSEPKVPQLGKPRVPLAAVGPKVLNTLLGNEVPLSENVVFLPEGLTEAQRIRDCNKDIFICGMTGQEQDTFVVSDIFDLFIFKPWTNAKYKLLENKLLIKRKTFVSGQID
jgi:CheY-like chemotaxis protein